MAKILQFPTRRCAADEPSLDVEPELFRLVREYLQDYFPDMRLSAIDWALIVDETGRAYLSAEQHRRVQKFFSVFGLSVSCAGPAESYLDGWSEVIRGPDKFRRYYTEYRKTYDALSRKFSDIDHAYIHALAHGDAKTVRRLMPRTRFYADVAAKMQKASGTALECQASSNQPRS